MKTIIYTICILLIGAGTKAAEVKPYMQEFSMSIDKLSPFLVEKSKYLQDQNAPAIEKTLSEFKLAAEKIKSVHTTESEDMKLRFEQLSEGISEAEASYKSGFRDYSHWVLKSSLNNCYVCHTNKSLNETHYKLNQSLTPQARADFLFLLRNYSEAIPAYEAILKSYPKNKSSIEDLDHVMQKLSYYYGKVLKNSKASLQAVEGLLANAQLPAETQNTLKQWQKYLTDSQQQISEKPQIKNRAQLEKFIKARKKVEATYNFYGSALARHQTTQALYDLLSSNNSNKQIKPWLLYYLAEAEKDERLSLFDMSTENYLKECMTQHTRSAAAKKCLKLYKEIMHDSFTGSSGTHMPSTINKQIQQYEKMILNK